MPAYYEERMKEGKVIKVQDVAFITYAASCSILAPDRSISPVSKRSYFTYTLDISSSRPSDPKPTANPGLLKSVLLPQIACLDLRLNPSTALPIRYLLLCLIKLLAHPGGAVRCSNTEVCCPARDQRGARTM